MLCDSVARAEATDATNAEALGQKEAAQEGKHQRTEPKDSNPGDQKIRPAKTSTKTTSAILPKIQTST